MNTVTRTWLTLRHRRKFASLGRGCTFPIPDLFVEGDVALGDYCRMRNDVTLRAREHARIVFGNRSGCSWGVLIDAHEYVEIGSYTAIAEFSYVTDAWPILRGLPHPDSATPYRVAPVRIGNDCFIGSRCVIGPGVTIGDGAVIGNNSIVLEDVGALEVWIGAPARRMGHRTQQVPRAKLREFEALLAEQGYQEDRYQGDL